MNDYYAKAAATIEPIYLCEKFDFCVGNVIKYILRADYKGDKKSDLEKALNYFFRARENKLPYKKLKKNKKLAEYYTNKLLDEFFNIDGFCQENKFISTLKEEIKQA